jgi:hypothetical protein
LQGPVGSQGPTGAQGNTGEKGLPGTPGSPLAAQASSKTLIEAFLPTTVQTVTIDVPADGFVLVDATGTAFTQSVSCNPCAIGAHVVDCDVGVRFEPTSPGPKTAQLLVTSDASNRRAWRSDGHAVASAHARGEPLGAVRELICRAREPASR